jgi:hypothetical protein
MRWTSDARLREETEMSGIEEYVQRDWNLFVDREHGPLAFRMILQPLVAAALAVRSGRRDAREERPPFGWTLVTNSSQRHELMKEAWADVGRLYVLAVVMDVIYQVIVFGTVHILQSLVVAAILAFPTYVILRGLTNRVARGGGPWGGASQ